MNSNKLALNRDKTQLLLLAKDNINKSSINIPAIPENKVPKNSLKFSGSSAVRQSHMERIPSGWKGKSPLSIKNQTQCH